MKQELTVTVNAELSVSDETAETCLALLKIYCRNQRGGDDIKMCDETCHGCALYNPKSYYCEFRKMPIDNKRCEEKQNDERIDTEWFADNTIMSVKERNEKL